MTTIKTPAHAWLSKLKAYEEPSLRKALIQILTSVFPYAGLTTLMLFLILNDYPYWMVLVVGVAAAGVYTRIFIIFHDCCHYSFLRSRRACELFGHICGMLTFTSYYDWQRSHLLHHATVGNLDKRGSGDVWTMTVKEYKAASTVQKIRYRILRNPFFLFIVAPPFLFLILNRFPGRTSDRKQIFSLVITNLFIGAVIAAAYWTIGIEAYVVMQMPVIFIGSIFGMWLFYVQHQFQNVYWARAVDWDFFRAAMEGSSYYKLQPVLRWLSGNIGFHHIHHLRSKIPNYNLKPCYDNIAELRDILPLTLFSSFKCMTLHLWDEENKELVSFASVR